jgi:hypothetical protein
MKLAAIALLLVAATCTRAQVIQVDGGAGSLFTDGTMAEGAGAQLYMPNNTWYAGVACEEGHLVIGASDTFLVNGFTTTVGDKILGFSFDNIGLAVALKGVSVQKRTEKTTITAFVGVTGPAFFTSFAQVTRAQQFGSGVLIQRTFGHIKLSSLDLIDGGKRTLAQGADLNLRHAKMSGSAGVINNQKYFEGNATVSPVKGLSLYAFHESYFTPYAAQGNSAGGSFSFNRFTLQAAVNESTSRGTKVVGTTAGIGFHIGPIIETTNWYQSNGKSILVHNVTENIRHFSLVETINQSHGQNSFAFGGGYRTNRFSASLTHSVQFLLDGRRYQQTTGVTVSMRIRDYVIGTNSITTPYGKVLWSATAETYRQLPGGVQIAGHETHGASGKYRITGTCKTSDGIGVEGCSVEVGGRGELAYSDSTGQFEIRQRKNAVVKITVDPKSFVGAGEYKILVAPDSAAPGMPVEIVVQRSQSVPVTTKPGTDAAVPAQTSATPRKNFWKRLWSAATGRG